MYRGKGIPALGYDFGAHKITFDSHLLKTPLNIASFGEYRDGELYVVDREQGQVFIISPYRHMMGEIAAILEAPERPVDARLLTLKVNEVYLSIQGESTWAGLRCAFVRLTACDLRCSYCDTAYAFYDGKKRTVGEVFDEVMGLGSAMVEITGGEPLLQKNVLPLMRMFCDAGKRVLIETSGAHDISGIDARVHRIMDLKTPSSGECGRNLFANIAHLTERDEVKFVIGSREDYEWARGQIAEHGIEGRCGAVLFSPVFGRIEPVRIVEWMLEDNVPARFQLQMHKFIWDPKAKGV